MKLIQAVLLCITYRLTLSQPTSTTDIQTSNSDSPLTNTTVPSSDALDTLQTLVPAVILLSSLGILGGVAYHELKRQNTLTCETMEDNSRVISTLEVCTSPDPRGQIDMGYRGHSRRPTPEKQKKWISQMMSQRTKYPWAEDKNLCEEDLQFALRNELNYILALYIFGTDEDMMKSLKAGVTKAYEDLRGKAYFLVSSKAANAPGGSGAWIAQRTQHILHEPENRPHESLSALYKRTGTIPTRLLYLDDACYSGNQAWLAISRQVDAFPEIVFDVYFVFGAMSEYAVSYINELHTSIPNIRIHLLENYFLMPSLKSRKEALEKSNIRAPSNGRLNTWMKTDGQCRKRFPDLWMQKSPESLFIPSHSFPDGDSVFLRGLLAGRMYDEKGDRDRLGLSTQSLMMRKHTSRYYILPIFVCYLIFTEKTHSTS